MLTEDGLALLVARIESLAGQVARLQAIADRNTHNGARWQKAQSEVELLRKDMAAAEKKIDEWAEYAGRLRAAINAIDPKALKRKHIVLPDMPGPLETEIPF